MVPRTKSQFHRLCRRIVLDGNFLEIASRGGVPNLSDENKAFVMNGLKKFYPRDHPKYKMVLNSNDISWRLNATRKSGCFVLHCNGEMITISTRCTPRNVNKDIMMACRGSVHYPQIIGMKLYSESEIDHVNEGGFEKLVEDWKKHLDISNLELHQEIIRNSVLDPNTSKKGFLTFREPILSNWLKFHKLHAKLEEVTKHEHLLRTKFRQALK